MTMATGSSITRAPRPSSLADVLDLILDKGLVIDAYVRVSVVGIEILTVDARVVVASVDTYLHYAEAVNRLDLTSTETKGIPGFFGENDSQNGDHGSNQKKAPARQALQKGEPRQYGDGEQDGDDRQRRKGLVSRLGERGRWDT